MCLKDLYDIYHKLNDSEMLLREDLYKLINLLKSKRKRQQSQYRISPMIYGLYDEHIFDVDDTAFNEYHAAENMLPAQVKLFKETQGKLYKEEPISMFWDYGLNQLVYLMGEKDPFERANNLRESKRDMQEIITKKRKEIIK